MRTTIELTDEQRAALLAMAARRGMRGYSLLVQEAIDQYVASPQKKSPGDITVLREERPSFGPSGPPVWERLDIKKRQLAQRQPFPPELAKNLEEWFRIELTCTSNAIEGNTLTRQETALVVEKGLTVPGKALREHLEAVNHAKALDYVNNLARRGHKNISETTILDIHRLVLAGIDDANAGRYRDVRVRIAGSTVVLPNPAKVPALMKELAAGLHKDKIHPAQRAAMAHFRLVTIHPFVDGNGRAARLLMNLILMQEGFPPAVIRKEDRLAYITALEKGQLQGDTADYDRLIFEAVDRSLDIYLEALSG